MDRESCPDLSMSTEFQGAWEEEYHKIQECIEHI